MTSKTVTEDGTAVATKGPRAALDDKAVANIGSFEDAINVLKASGIAVTNVKEYIGGLDVTDKLPLIGTEFIILGIRFNDTKEGKFVSVTYMTRNAATPAVFNDGGTGIYAQLTDIVAERIESGMSPEHALTGIHCPKGLRISEYEYADPKTGEMRPAATFYLA